MAECELQVRRNTTTMVDRSRIEPFNPASTDDPPKLLFSGEVLIFARPTTCSATQFVRRRVNEHVYIDTFQRVHVGMEYIQRSNHFHTKVIAHMHEVLELFAHLMITMPK